MGEVLDFQQRTASVRDQLLADIRNYVRDHHGLDNAALDWVMTDFEKRLSFADRFWGHIIPGSFQSDAEDIFQMLNNALAIATREIIDLEVELYREKFTPRQVQP